MADAAALQAEVDQLKLRVEELELDNEIMTEEMEVLKAEQASGGGGGGAGAEEVAAARDEAKQLRAALAALRDASVKEREEAQRRVDAVEKALAEAQAEFREQMDEAGGMDAMVESLTEKNMQLEEELASQKEKMAELESLKELSDEMEALHAETEAEMTESLEKATSKINELEAKVAKQNDQLNSAAQTVLQFRQAKGTLEKEVTELRAQAALRDSQTDALATKSQAVLSQNMELQSQADRAFALAINADVASLQAKETELRASMTVTMLPPGAFAKELQVLDVVLMADRVLRKIDILRRYICEQYHFDEPAKMQASIKSADAVVDFGLYFGVHRELSELALVMAHLAGILRRGDLDTVFALAHRGKDFAGADKAMDLLLQLLKGEITERALDDALPAARKRMLTVQRDQLNAHPVRMRHVMEHEMEQVSMRGAEALLHVCAADRAVALALEGDKDTTGLVAKVHGLVAVVQSRMEEVSGVVRKLLRDVESKELRASSLVQKKLDAIQAAQQSSIEQMEKLRKALEDGSATQFAEESAASAALQHVEAATEAAEGAMDGIVQTVNEISMLVASGAMDANEDDAGKDKDKDMGKGKGSSDEAAEGKTSAAWDAIAASRRAQIEEAAGMQAKVVQAEERSTEKSKTIRHLEQMLGEAAVKTTTLEKKMETFASKAAIADNLSSEVKKLKQQGQNYEEAMDLLQNDIVKLERENKTLKEQIKNMPKRQSVVASLAQDATKAAAASAAAATPDAPAPASSTADGEGARDDAAAAGAAAASASSAASPSAGKASLVPAATVDLGAVGGAGGLGGAMALSSSSHEEVAAIRTAMRHLQAKNSALQAELARLRLGDLARPLGSSSSSSNDHGAGNGHNDYRHRAAFRTPAVVDPTQRRDAAAEQQAALLSHQRSEVVNLAQALKLRMASNVVSLSRTDAQAAQQDLLVLQRQSAVAAKKTLNLVQKVNAHAGATHAVFGTHMATEFVQNVRASVDATQDTRRIATLTLDKDADANNGADGGARAVPIRVHDFAAFHRAVGAAAQG